MQREVIETAWKDGNLFELYRVLALQVGCFVSTDILAKAGTKARCRTFKVIFFFGKYKLNSQSHLVIYH
jgi:hypothetical protein